MMDKEGKEYTISYVKEKVINTILVVAFFVGTIAYILSTVSRFLENNFTPSIIFESLVFLSLVTITSLRKKINYNIKAYVMVVLILFFSISDAYFFGLFSSARVYLILVPVLSIIFFPVIRSLIIFAGSLLIFLGIGWFHHKGILLIPESYEPSLYILRMYPWIINAIHISAVGLIIMYVTNRFFSTFSKLINNLEESNKKISEKERNYREIFNSTSEAIAILNATDGKIVDVNDIMLRMFGYDSKDEIGKLLLKDVSANIDTSHLKKAQTFIRKAIHEGPQIFEWHSKKKNGHTFYTEITLKQTEIGGINRVLAVIRDITSRKDAEKALKESEERYRTIIDAFPDVIMISDLQGNILFGNKVLEKVTGITPGDYKNPDRKPQVHPEDMALVQKEKNQLFNSEKSHSPIVEYRFITASGDELWFSGIMSKIWLNGELCMQTITRDITQKKKSEKELAKYRNHLEQLVQERTEELESTNEELKAINQELYQQREELESTLIQLQSAQKQLVHSEKMASLGVLAAGVAHEINNPLNFIKGGAIAIESYIDENLNTHRKKLFPLLDIVKEGVTRAANIVTSLNHYSRKDDLISTDCEMHNIIDNCLLILHNQIKKRIQIIRKYTPDPPKVLGNEGKLHQALLNILTNAVHAIENTGDITIETSSTNDSFIIIISDTGMGISQKNLLKITDPFFTTKDPGKGTGLGLSITQNIINEHEGSLEFESNLGKGTKVFVNLPLK